MKQSLTGRFFSTVLFIFLILLLSSPSNTKQQKSLCFHHAVIIDGNGGTPIEDGSIVISGERIEAVGELDQLKVPSDAQMINLKGKTVMPGLADMHVHLCGGWDGMSTDMLGYQRYLNSLLYSGVITVLDLGNNLEYILQLRQEVREGRIPGPRIYCAGPLINGADPSWPSLSYALSSVHQIPKLVAHLKRVGVDVVKAYSGLSNQMVYALASAADREGLRVFVHQSSKELADLGITAYAHMFEDDISDDFMRLMKTRGIRCITTLAVTESGIGRRFVDLSFLDDPLIEHTTPPWFLKDLKSWVSRTINMNSTSHSIHTRREEILKRAQRNAKKMFDYGIVLAAGTDAPHPGVFLGEGIHRELELLVEAGLTPLQAITLATKNAAVLIEAEREWGTLSSGRLANFLVVNGRPDKDIRQTRNIEMVILEGKILDRDKLKFDEKKDPGFRVHK